tara:strand:- start:949 stop:1128 length:180 start_codon:yes stop_codon:yes gene_type:complete
MSELGKAIYLLVDEIRALRAELNFSSTKKILLKEKKDQLNKADELIAQLNKRRKTNGDC